MLYETDDRFDFLIGKYSPVTKRRPVNIRVHQIMYIIVKRQGRQYTYKRNIEVHLRTHCCRAKARSITFSDCVSVALVIQMQSACAVLYCPQWSV
jgi:hypothetical protein